MKTSEALRLADAMGLPDRRHEYVVIDTDQWGGEKPPCCAVGGAAIASGSVRLEPDPDADGLMVVIGNYREVENCEDWKQGETAANVGSCPGEHCGTIYTHPHYLLEHLYDTHQWSRTRIADWLETL